MILRIILLLAPLLAGCVSVVYCASIAATGQLLKAPLWSPAVAYASALPWVVLLASMTSKRPASISAVARYVWKEPLKRWTILTGGVLGAAIGMSVAFVPPRIGLGPFFVFFVTGQVITAFVLDRTRRQRLTTAVCGSVFVILGATTFQCRTLQSLNSAAPSHATLCLGVAFAAGTCAVMQGAANGSLTTLLHGSYTKTAVYSFGSGLCCLAVIAYALQPAHLPTWQHVDLHRDWWKFLAGALAISSMLTMTVMPRYLGFGLTTSWMVAGELLTSLLFDHFGLLESKTNRADLVRIVGVLMVLGGAVSLHLDEPEKHAPVSVSIAKKEVSTPSPPTARERATRVINDV